MVVESERIHHNAGDDAAGSRIDEIVAALHEIPPRAKFQKTAMFSKLYPVIRGLLQNNISQKAILGVLENYGLKLHPARFKELLAAENEAASRKASE